MILETFPSLGPRRAVSLTAKGEGSWVPLPRSLLQHQLKNRDRLRQQRLIDRFRRRQQKSQDSRSLLTAPFRSEVGSSLVFSRPPDHVNGPELSDGSANPFDRLESLAPD